MKAYFKQDLWAPTIPEIADYYRQRKIALVIFQVDCEHHLGIRRYSNEEVARLANENSDIMIPFASIDPHKGKLGAREARRLVEDFGVQGFKFHPSQQGFYPHDRMAYPLYEAIQESGKPALFHTGQTGVGSGMRGGYGIKLEYSNPIHLDQVAIDFPDMKIVMAHPSFPGRRKRSRSRSTSPTSTSTCRGGRRNTFRRSWCAMRIRCSSTRCCSDRIFPAITPDRWLADFEAHRDQAGGAPADPEAKRHPPARAVAGAGTARAARRSSAGGISMKQRPLSENRDHLKTEDDMQREVLGAARRSRRARPRPHDATTKEEHAKGY